MSQPAFDLEFDDGGVPTYSVGELSDAINGVLRNKFSDGVWVRGEIQGYNERGPHAYFRIGEETETGKATLNIQFFAPSRARLKPLLAKHRLRLADGLKVRIFGHLDYFAPSGSLGLKMSGIDPRFTLGDMALQRDDVVRRLIASGMFDANRRTRLPAVPLRIGVVASTDSAAWADFVHELERSNLAFRITVINVRVQGEWAVTEISQAIQTLARSDALDAVAVIRGGGSRTELATFDSEAIAAAIASSPLPIFTGLGHEIDRSVADDVAHSALKTPTACAAALVERVVGFQQRVEGAWAAIERRAQLSVADAHARFETVASSIEHRTNSAVIRSHQRLDQRVGRLHSESLRITQQASQHLRSAVAALSRCPRQLDGETRTLDAINERVRLLDPVNTMARGWSITRDSLGQTIRSADQIVPGAIIITSFATGTAQSIVQETNP